MYYSANNNLVLVIQQCHSIFFDWLFKLNRRAVLREWKRKKSFEATYNNLLIISCQAHASKVAKSICDVLQSRVEIQSIEERGKCL